MVILTYNIPLQFERPETERFWLDLLSQVRDSFNECAIYMTENNTPLDLKIVHNEVYDWMRSHYELMPAQAVIKTYKEVLAAIRSIKANKHEDAKTPERKQLSMRLDKRLYDHLAKDSIMLTCETKNKRTKARLLPYDQVLDMFAKYPPKDPLIFYKDGRFFLSVPFEVPETPCQGNTAIGVDLGVRRAAVTSEGKAYVSKKYNTKRRQVRYLKRVLKSKNTKSSRRHLKKLKHKERNISKERCYEITNQILSDTDASVIVMEDLTKLKKNTGDKIKNGAVRKKHNSLLSQVPFYKLKEILTYKALLVGKRVETVNPRDTSKLNSQTGKKDGTRKGCRYYCKNGEVYDADWNAAVNIGQRSKHPVSCSKPVDGGLVVLTGQAYSQHANRGEACAKPQAAESLVQR